MFRKADSSVYEHFLELMEKIFPELSGLSFGLLFREQIKKSRGNVTLAEVCKPSKLMSYYAVNDRGNPFDFIMIFDEMAWACASDKDRVRIMRHELRHVRVNDKGAACLVTHDFQDFYVEVELNSDDPAWCQKLCEVTLAGYDQIKNDGKDPRLDRRDAEDIVPVTREPEKQVKIESAMNTKRSKTRTEGAVKGDIKAFADKVAKDTVRKLEEKAESSGVVSRLDEMARKRGLLPANGKSATIQ
jgi:hypothetical protein